MSQENVEVVRKAFEGGRSTRFGVATRFCYEPAEALEAVGLSE